MNENSNQHDSNPSVAKPVDKADDRLPNSGVANHSLTAGVQKQSDTEVNQVIRKFGGRHLIFRTKLEGWSLIPTPYALISDFSGPVWFFYGMGQIWLTHKKFKQYDGWTARVSRFGGANVVKLLDALESQIIDFTHFCNEHGIEGTIIVDPGIIEFHWTFGYELKKEKSKPDQCSQLEERFSQLTEAFLAAKQELRI